MTERAASSSPPLWLQDQWDAADVRVARWRVRGFVAACAMWVFPSLFVWLLVLTSLTGGLHGSDPTEGLLGGRGDALGVFALAVLVQTAAAGGLIGIARWAFGNWRTATMVGLAATVWPQVLATVWVVV